MAQFAVDNSLIIAGFDFYIDKGLVYPTVVFKRQKLGAVVRLTMNGSAMNASVMEFFNKVREGIIMKKKHGGDSTRVYVCIVIVMSDVLPQAAFKICQVALRYTPLQSILR
jgi:hypothetical protein